MSLSSQISALATRIGQENKALWAAVNGKVAKIVSTDNAVVRFDGTGGAVQNSGVTVDDSNNLSVPASLYVDGSASSDPYLRIRSVDGRTPYLVLQSVGANDLYLGWSRGNTTRFYFRCTADEWSIRSADDTGNIWGSAPYGAVFAINRATGKLTLGGHTTGTYTAGLEFGSSGPREMAGPGSPELAVSAPPGSTWRQTDAEGHIWHKVSGTGNTGWVPEFGVRFRSVASGPYTLVLADAGRIVETNIATANTITVPCANQVSFPIGTQLTILQVGAGQTTIAGTTNSGQTSVISGTPGLKLRTQFSAATLIKRAINGWVLIGDLVA